MAEQYKAIHPIKYYRDYINHNIRPDGREFDKFRPIRINVNSIGTADGSAIVKLGNTTVVCGIKAELTQPTVTEPENGYIVPNIDLTPLCSSRFRPGMTNDEAQVLSAIVDDLIKNSKWIDPKQLCISKEKLVWILYCDVTCLDFDGGILDASVVALCAALRCLQLPEVKYDVETGNYTVNEKETKSIELSESCPVATTCSIFDDKIILTDPDNEEEDLSTAIITIATCEGELCLVNKPGGVSITQEQLDQCMKYALKREQSISKLISSVLVQ